MRINAAVNKNAAEPTLILYKKDGSPPSNAVRMVAAILGLQFEYKEPDILNLELRSPEFRKINPMSTIPVLKDGDYVIAESHAIIVYLIEKYGGEHKASLYPYDPQVRGLVNQILFFDAFVMFRRLQDVAKPAWLSGKPGPTEEDLRLIDEAYGTLEAFLECRVYVASDHITVADVSLGSTVTAMQCIHPLDAESHAIILYLIEKYGGEHKASLYPYDPQVRGLVNQILFFDAFVMFRRLQDVAKPAWLSGKPGPTEEDLRLIDEAYGTLEAFLECRLYVASDHITVADVSLGSTVTAMQCIHPLDAERFPKCKSWLDRLEAKPYFKEINEPGATAFETVLKHFWKINNASK